MPAVCLISADAGDRLLLIFLSLIIIGILTAGYIIARHWWDRRGN